MDMMSKQIYYQEHREEILEKKRLCHIENKAIIAEKSKVRYDENSDELLEKYKIRYESNKEELKEKINCDCGGVYRKNAEGRHKRTKEHMDFLKL